MITAAIIAGGWICLLAGIVAGLSWHAYRLAGVTLLTRRLLAEFLTAAALFAAVLWVMPLAGIGLGLCPTIP